jgi:hypothetical protein
MHPEEMRLDFGEHGHAHSLLLGPMIELVKKHTRDPQKAMQALITAALENTDGTLAGAAALLNVVSGVTNDYGDAHFRAVRKHIAQSN